MIRTSADFQHKINELSRTFKCRIKKSDAVVDCNVNNISIYKGMMGEEIVLGSLYIPYMEAEIQELSGSLMGGLITPEIGLMVGKNPDGSKKFEYIEMGTFEVSEESYCDGIVKIKAAGLLSARFIGLYTSELQYPASVAAIAAELETQTGVAIIFDDDIDTSLNIDYFQAGLQRSEMVRYLAGFVGACATEDEKGNVVIKRIASGDAILVTGDRCIQVPSFSSSYDITGLRVVTQNATQDENGSEVPEIAFSCGATVKMEYANPFMTEEAFNSFAPDVVEYSFNPAEVELALGDPRIEPWDVVSFASRQGKTYSVPCLNIEHTFDGGFSTKITAPGAEKVSQSAVQVGPISEMVERTYTKMEAVENLLAGKISSTEVEALYAKVKDLNAAQAEIGSAKADIADINTLLFGSATGDALHTGFANAVVALISDATIDSAKIVSVIADKITSGQLNTNKVSVQSESGQLRITGDTIIIKDADRTRVQIGKDANSDYNIYIIDAEGNIMFDATGVHESAIKSPIIVDDMIAENADISAKKLNIDSLFSEINASQKTIKATRVVLDDTGQELSVAFSRMVTDIDNIEKEVQSQGTSLNMIQGQIESKIWQQDIDEATDELSTKHTRLEQNLEGFKATVSDVYATKKELDSLEIGGRNLLRGTKDFSGFNKTGNVEIIVDDSGFCYAEFLEKNEAESAEEHIGWIDSMIYPIKKEDVADKACSLSFEVKGEENVNALKSNLAVEFILCDDASGERKRYMTREVEIVATDKWQRIEYTASLTEDFFTFGNATLDECSYFGVKIYSKSSQVKIRKIKLELGIKATDWTPSPEDTEDYFIKETGEIFTKIEQTVNKITMSIVEGYVSTSDLEGYKKDISELFEASKDGFSFNFNQLEEKITNLGNEIIERNQFIRLENGEIIIGKSDSPVTSVYTNNALEFRYNGVTVARFTNEVLEVRNINVQNQLKLHENWAFRQGEYINDRGYNLNLVWLG